MDSNSGRLSIPDAIVTKRNNGWTDRHFMALVEISCLEYDRIELLKALDEESKRVEDSPHV